MKSKWAIAVALIMGLGACKQVINHGPVGGADITVTTLDGTEVYSVPNGTASRDSIIANEGQAEWDTSSEARRMRKLGKHVFPKNGDFGEDTWYVMVASGGQDFDVNQDGTTDSDTGTQVAGTLRAIVRGELLNGSAGFAVSPMTESAYRFVADYLDELSDAELQQALDELAPDLVGDTNNSGSVDYDDVLGANRYFNTDSTLPAQVDDLNTLASAIATGEAESMLNLLSRSLYSTNAPNVVAEKQYENTISALVIEANNCQVCHQPNGSGNGSNNKLAPLSDPDYVGKNTQNFRNLVNTQGADYVLEKVNGTRTHGGGAVLRTTDPEYDDFEAWLNLL